jgi:ABC-type multidrug transport system fused ATPase/permease subunit
LFSTFKNINRILLSKEKRKITAFIIADIFISLADIFSVALLVLVISFYTGQSKLQLSLVLWIKNTNQYTPVLLLLLFFIVKNAAGYLLQKHRYQLAYAIALRLSLLSLHKFQSAAFKEYSYTDPAIHIRQINHQPIEFCNYVLLGIQQILTELFLILFALTGLAIVNWTLFLLLIPVIVPAVLLVLYIIKKRSKNIRTKIQQANNYTLQHLTEGINGYVESNIFNSNSFFADRYRNSLQAVNKHLIEMQLVQKIAPVIMELFGVTGLIFLIVQHQHAGAITDTVLLGAFIAAAYKIIPGAARIMSASALARSFSYTVKDMPLPQNGTSVITAEATVINKIAFNNIFFGYGEKQTIHNFNFNISKGNMVAFWGNSGSGKTTLINLLLGFIEQAGGEILVNDMACTATERKNYWPQVAYVKQQNFLFHASVKTNIILSDAASDTSRLNKAIAAAGLQDFLQTLPEGINTIISQEGRNISGGQRQRIAIARALYKDASLLILDEPFNELDENAVADLMQTFKAYAGNGKIVLLVTHNTTAARYYNEMINIE